MNKTHYFLFFCFFTISVFGQEKANQDGSKFQEEYQLKITKTTSAIKIDGDLSEEIWKTADAAQNFWQKYPNDLIHARRQTLVRAAYDEKYLYFAAICTDTSNYVIQTLKRDTRYWDSDGFAVVLDPVNTRSNGFLFGVSPYNVQSEDLISGNIFSIEEINFSWDNKWLSATKRFDDHWVVEMAIPFKTLRFEANQTKWGINFVRNDAKNNAYNVWTHVPVQFFGTDFGYTGALIWDKAPAKQGTNASIIPYVTGGISTEKGVDDNKSRLNGGLDAKLSVTSSLNLDVTINPDFSQIEVDRQVTNLTRFNIFFPERRTFFLENDDVFSSYGAPPFRPFYSRTVGLDANGQSVPIIAGLRLSGNLNQKLRIGVMNMQTNSRGKVGDADRQAAQNYSAVSFNQRVGSRSILKGYFLNKQGFLDQSEIKKNPSAQYGRNTGLEFNYYNSSGSINGWGGLHVSMKPQITTKNMYSQVGGGYFGKNFNIFTDFATFGDNYYADMGFVARIETFATKGRDYAMGDTTYRKGFLQNFTSLGYNIRPKTGVINMHKFSLENFMVYLSDNRFNERQTALQYVALFKNTALLSASFEPQETDLLYYTALPSIKPLAPGRYVYNQGQLLFASDGRKKLAFETSFRAGGFYNGTLQQFRTELTFRTQPWGSFNVGYEQNKLNFPDEYGDETFQLINSKAEVSFSTKLFWTTFLQYNTQRNNFNINSRLQWRYKPMSDFFLVYTDNYLVNPNLQNKNKAIVFKWNYWLTI
jgi:Domain of unknown function (DUF5916)/Carbohydrate family 9 binding domain-like